MGLTGSLRKSVLWRFSLASLPFFFFFFHSFSGGYWAAGGQTLPVLELSFIITGMFVATTSTLPMYR